LVNNWQEFEQLSRTIIREWGFQVGNSPQKRYEKYIDINGKHLLLKKAIKRGTEPKAIEFVGECKSWSGKIDIDIVDQIVGYRENFELDNVPTIMAIFSKNGFTERALNRSKNQDILAIDLKELYEIASHSVIHQGPGIISRTSFPFYSNINCLYAILEEMKQKNFDYEWTACDLWSYLKQNKLWFNNKGKLYAKSLIFDHLNVLALLGIINWNTNTKNPMKYRMHKFIKILTNQESWRKEVFQIMQYNIVKIPWVRELLLAIKIHPNKNYSYIFNLLEKTQPGFDVESLRFSLKLAKDLELIYENNQLNSEISKFLWQKLELFK